MPFIELRLNVPPPELMSLALRTTNTLQGFTYGFLLANEDGDVDSRLIRKMQDRREEFEGMGIDLQFVRCRMNA